MGGPTLTDLIEQEPILRVLDVLARLAGLPAVLLDGDGTLLAAGSGGGVPAPLEDGTRTLSLPVEVAGERRATLVLGPYRLEGESPCRQVPILSPARVEEAMDCAQIVLQTLADMGQRALELRHEREERRRAEDALRASDAQYRGLVEQLNEGIIVIDLEGCITFVNPRMADLMGYSATELPGRFIFEFLDAGQKTEFLERLERRKAGVIEQYEVRVLRKDGRAVHFSASGTPLRDSHGEVVGAFAVMSDVTERRQAEEDLRTSEEKFRSVFESMLDVFYRGDAQGRLTLMSPSGASLLGYDSVDELIGRDIAEAMYFNPSSRERLLARLQECDFLADYEETLRRKDGAPVVISTNTHLIRDENGTVLGVEGVFYDITERKEAQEALRQSAERYRLIVDNVHDAIFTHLVDGTISFASESVRRLGYTPEEVVGRNIFDFVHPEDAEVAREGFEATVTRLTRARIELRIRRKNGTYEWEEEHSDPIVQDGRLMQVTGVLRDISERKQAELALKTSEARYRTLLETQGEGVGYVDPEETFLFVNSAAESIFGVPKGGLTGRNLKDFLDAEEYQKVRQETGHRIEGQMSTYELSIRRPDGTRRDILVTATPLCEPEGGLQGIMGIFRDMTEWKRAEETLRRLSAAINQTSDSVIITDTQGVILYANPATEALAGIPMAELNGQSLKQFRCPKQERDFYRELWASVLRGEVWQGRLMNQRRDGSCYETTSTVAPVRDEAGRIQYVVTSSRDITREAELEAQLRHSQRMEAIGVLAGGIAHDFNNILTPVLGYAEMALGRAGPDPKLAEYLVEIASAGRRAAELVQQILTFSRQTEQVKQAVSIGSIVKESLKLLRAAIPATIAIHQRIGAPGIQVLADPSQLHQVVMNLCTNAFHAMKDQGGVLEVLLDTYLLEQPLVLLGTTLSPGEYVRLRIVDSGRGIDEETQKKIFLPFFTTKKVGEGTGLGLSIVHGIAVGMEGGISVESQLGKGSTFTVYFPAIRHGTAKGALAAGAAPRGHERLLVVDDETAIGGMLKGALSQFGYDVEVRTSSVKALETLHEDPESFDLVLTDLTMPGLTGLELAQKLWALRPGLPVILMTGHSEDLDEESAKALGLSALLRKPVSLNVLGQAVRNILDARK